MGTQEEVLKQDGRKLVLWISDATDKVYRIDVLSAKGELTHTAHKPEQITREEAKKLF